VGEGKSLIAKGKNKPEETTVEHMPSKTSRGLISVWFFAFTLAISSQPTWADEESTERNKALVRDFYTTVLIGRDVDAAPRFLRPDYKRELLNVIGENNMVVIYVRQTWTGRDSQHHQALGFDMFRVQDGKIAEHWDAD
jgi:predicted SnoaL-like aldol condensation-catalyzing enzyme